MGVLTRTSILAFTLAAAACDDADVAPVVWIPIDAIDGPLRPDLAQPANPATPRDRFRVATYNTLKGLDPDALAPALLAHPALAHVDVWLMQETDRFDDIADAARLAGALDMGYVYAPTSRMDDGTRGLSILSRFPVRDVEIMFLQSEWSIDLEETSARSAVAVEIDTPSGPLRIVNVHLDVAQNISERILQLRPAVFDTPTPILVGGDFNTNEYVWADPFIPLFPLDAAAETDQAPVLDEYMRAIGYDTPTSSFGDTWHGLPEDQRLDSIYVRGLATGDGAVERAIDQSDHWPVWLDIELRP